MSFARVFRVPDYCKDFVCKGPSCRKTCCRGWGVSLSMKEYFRLIGMPCSKKLRRTLDCAFYPAQDRDPERYAMFRKKEDGDCPMHLANGWCGLQSECGEGVLPAVCRYYPRAVRGGYAYECSLSASCEEVAELLINRKEPISFEDTTLTFDLPEPRITADSEETRFYHALRERCFSIVQNRSARLADRIGGLGSLLREVRLRTVTSAEGLAALPDPQITHTANGDREGAAQKGFETIRKISNWFEENSVSLEEYGETVEAVYRGGASAYAEAAEAFSKRFPNWEISFENLIVNHLYYDKFPFSDRFGSFREAYFSLCGCYAFLRYIAVGYTAAHPSPEDLVDVVAAVFRVSEHSDFDRNVAVFLKEEGFTSVEELKPMIEV